MSNFQDNFHREEENKLDYDDSAFYYFFFSLITCINVPFTYHILKTMVTGEKKIELSGKNCDCAKCKETIKRRQKVYSKTWIRPGFFFKVTVVVILWIVWFLTLE
jgi:translocation protein SEC63